MILDHLSNARLYESIHPRFKQAFDYLRTHQMATIPAGKLELEGDDLFLNIVDLEGKAACEAKMETHNRYIDIQYLVNAEEVMGWKERTQLQMETAPYNIEKDITFYADKATCFVTVAPGHFAVFFPTDGHQPGIAEGKSYRKVIVKVKV